nr:hypothetical protein [uncultured Rhodopila sp.]
MIAQLIPLPTVEQVIRPSVAPASAKIDEFATGAAENLREGIFLPEASKAEMQTRAFGRFAPGVSKRAHPTVARPGKRRLGMAARF